MPISFASTDAGISRQGIHRQPDRRSTRTHRSPTPSGWAAVRSFLGGRVNPAPTQRRRQLHRHDHRSRSFSIESSCLMTHPARWLIATLALLPSALLAQGVIVAPHAVFIGHATRSGSITLYNPSDQPVEVSVSFGFGYPTTDSAGSVSLELTRTRRRPGNLAPPPGSRPFPAGSRSASRNARPSASSRHPRRACRTESTGPGSSWAPRAARSRWPACPTPAPSASASRSRSVRSSRSCTGRAR